MAAKAGTVSTFVMKRHDRRPTLQMTIKRKSDGAAMDLTGVTSVQFLMYDVAGVQKVNAPGSVVSPPTSGIVQYAWAAADTNTEGEYRAEFELSYGGTDKLTVPNTGFLAIRIYEDLNNA